MGKVARMSQLIRRSQVLDKSSRLPLSIPSTSAARYSGSGRGQFDYAIGMGRQCERNFEAKHLSKEGLRNREPQRQRLGAEARDYPAQGLFYL